MLIFRTYSKFDHEKTLNKDLESSSSDEDEGQNENLSDKSMESSFEFKNQTYDDKVKMYQAKYQEKEKEK
jgi:hypothetical protein